MSGYSKPDRDPFEQSLRDEAAGWLAEILNRYDLDRAEVEALFQECSEAAKTQEDVTDLFEAKLKLLIWRAESKRAGEEK